MADTINSLYYKALKAAAKRRVSKGEPRLSRIEREKFVKGVKTRVRRKLPRKVLVRGRRWRQHTYGNTYFTAEIFVNDKLVHKISREYGYGDHYLDVAWEWLEKNKYVPSRETYPSGGKQAAWRHAQDLGIKLERDVIDVPRKRDL